MEQNLNIVPGEAPESDDEESTIYTNLSSAVKSIPRKGTAIAGEAPESDSSSSSQVDEAEVLANQDVSVGSISSAASALSLVSPTSDVPKVPHMKDDVKYTSLLHKKLRERNISLRRGVEDFIHQTVETAARNLNSIDQHLLKTQGTLQEAVASLRLLQSNLSQIHSKLTVATSSTYLPTVNIEALQ